MKPGEKPGLELSESEIGELTDIINRLKDNVEKIGDNIEKIGNNVEKIGKEIRELNGNYKIMNQRKEAYEAGRRTAKSFLNPYTGTPNFGIFTAGGTTGNCLFTRTVLGTDGRLVDYNEADYYLPW